MESFLTERFQRVLLNDQSSKWACIEAGVPQGWILGHFLFLIYVKLFTGDTSIFSTIHDINFSANDFYSDLQKISEWAFKWNPTKQAQEVIFSQRIIKPNYPFIKLNNLPVQNPSSQNYLGMILDEKLNFESHLKETYLKFDKGVGAIKKNCEIFCWYKHF